MMAHNFENCHNLTCKLKSRQIGYDYAIEEMKEVNEKLRAEIERLKEKEVNKARDLVFGNYYCPSCNAGKGYQGYCVYCGQKSY